MSIRCLKCMKEFEDGVSKCPHCGYIESADIDTHCFLPPRTVLKGRYMVGCSLGNGGFGVTYVAWDSLLEKKVAIKEYLPSELATRNIGQTQVTVRDPNSIEKYEKGKSSFLEESRRLAKFNGVKGIVNIYDCFDENDTAYLVMECLEGKTLQQLLNERKKLPFKEALPIFIDILEALEIVHNEGMMHRDIAPDNIFVCDDGSAKLIDFGAARFMTTSQSRSLSMILKIGYAPVEQYTKHGNQGPWTDVYAVAATLYHTITGIVPPDSYDRVEEDKLKKPSSHAKKLPAHAETAILNALNIIETNRTQTAKQFAEELKGDIDVERIREKIKREDTGRIAKWMKYTAALIGLAIVAFGALFAVSGGRIFGSSEYDMPDGMTRVPFVLNDEISAADVKVSDSSLHMVISDRVTDVFFDNNFVLLQNPRSGNVAYAGSAVNVTASMRPDEYFIPDLTNYEREAAVEVLTAAGFNVYITESESDIIAPDAVISQDPPANTIVVEGSDVTLIINGKKENEFASDNYIKVPDYVGTQFNDAQKDAYRKKLYIEIVKGEYSDTIPKGQILLQDPEAGRNIQEGETIKVNMCLGKRTIIVPSLVYMKEKDALDKIQDRLLVSKVEYVTDATVAKGLVVEQSPKPGMSIYENGEVTISVSTGYEVMVPDVVGKMQENAQSTLTSSALGYAVTYENSSAPVGEVISQSIKAGTMVEQGTVVEIVVSSGSNQVKVTGVKLNRSKLTLDCGEIYTLIATISPKKATTTAVTWSSSNSKVVSVDKSGVLTAKGIGTATVTVTTKDGNHTATCEVTVIKQISKLSVTKKPDKTGYYMGESADYSGLVLTAYYTDGSSEDVTKKAELSGFSSEKGGDKTVMAKYSFQGTSKQTTFVLHVRTLKSIIVTPPSKTVYEMGDKLVINGYKVMAKYDDGVTRDVTDSNKTKYEGFDSSKPGRRNVNVTYTEGATVMSTFSYRVNGGLRIVEGDQNLYKGDTFTLTAAYKNNATGRTVSWKTSNSGCVRISGSSSGNSCTVVCDGLGTATITAVDDIGEESAVVIKSQKSVLMINENSFNIDNQGSSNVTVTLKAGQNSSVSNITWTSSDPSTVKATPTATGVKLEGLKKGKVTLTAVDNVGGGSDQITVGVYGPWQTGIDVTKDTSKYDYGTETTVYKSRKRTMDVADTKTVENSSSTWTVDGYTWYKTDDKSSVGSTQGPVDSHPGNKDGRNVWTETVVTQKAWTETIKEAYDELTGYWYYRYDGGSGKRSNCWSNISGYTATTGAKIYKTKTVSVSDRIPKEAGSPYNCNKNKCTEHMGVYGYINSKYGLWFGEKPVYTHHDAVTKYHPEEKKTVYYYTDTNFKYLHYFYKWGSYGNWSSWSDWSETKISSGESLSGTAPNLKKTDVEVREGKKVQYRELP